MAMFENLMGLMDSDLLISPEEILSENQEFARVEAELVIRSSLERQSFTLEITFLEMFMVSLQFHNQNSKKCFNKPRRRKRQKMNSFEIFTEENLRGIFMGLVLK